MTSSLQLKQVTKVVPTNYFMLVSDCDSDNFLFAVCVFFIFIRGSFHTITISDGPFMVEWMRRPKYVMSFSLSHSFVWIRTICYAHSLFTIKYESILSAYIFLLFRGLRISSVFVEMVWSELCNLRISSKYARGFKMKNDFVFDFIESERDWMRFRNFSCLFLVRTVWFSIWWVCVRVCVCVC